MDSVMKTVKDFITGLTGVLASVIGLGIVAAIVFGGDVYFFGNVIETIMGYVVMLGATGFAGLIVLLIVLGVLNIK